MQGQLHPTLTHQPLMGLGQTRCCWNPLYLHFNICPCHVCSAPLLGHNQASLSGGPLGSLSRQNRGFMTWHDFTATMQGFGVSSRFTSCHYLRFLMGLAWPAASLCPLGKDLILPRPQALSALLAAPQTPTICEGGDLCGHDAF